MKNNFEITPKIKRVDKLRETDSLKEDSVKELAYKEDQFREKLEKSGLSSDEIGEIADNISDEILEKIEAQKEGRMDVLTGLANRRSFLEIFPKILSARIREEKKAKEERMEREVKEERREKKDIAILLIDLDDFKMVNEELGYAAGDEALKKLAKILDECARGSDFVFRYGGEEFIIILSPANSTQADFLAKRIIKKVKETGIVVRDKNENEHTLKKTVSVGIFSTSQDSNWENIEEGELNKKCEEMVKKANVAVKVAKKTGKNKGVVFDKSMMDGKKE